MADKRTRAHMQMRARERLCAHVRMRLRARVCTRVFTKRSFNAITKHKSEEKWEFVNKGEIFSVDMVAGVRKKGKG